MVEENQLRNYKLYIESFENTLFAFIHLIWKPNIGLPGPGLGLHAFTDTAAQSIFADQAVKNTSFSLLSTAYTTTFNCAGGIFYA